MKKNGFKAGEFLNGWNPYLIVAVFSFLIYGNTVFNKYNLDDELVTSTSASKQHWLTSKGVTAIPEIFKSNYYKDAQGYSYEYRPVVLTTFAIEHSLFGDNPHIGHLINVLLYSLLCMLLLSVLSLLLKDYSSLLPLLITLFFAAFPMHTEVVASLKNRDEILALTGGLGSLYFFISYVDRRNLLLLLGAVLCFITAMLSKQTIISFVVVIPVLLFLFREMSVAKAITISAILGVVIFPLIQRNLVIERVGLIAGVLVINMLFYGICYPDNFKRLKFAKRFKLKGIHKPDVIKVSENQKQKIVASLNRKWIFAAAIAGLLVSSALLLAYGFTLYLLPLSLLIPLLIFFPSDAERYFQCAAAALALYLSYTIKHSDVVNMYLILYALNFLQKQVGRKIDLVIPIIIFITGLLIGDGLTPSLIVIICMAITTINPQTKRIIIVLIHLLAVGFAFTGLFEAWNDSYKIYSSLVFMTYLILTFIIFYFPKRKMAKILMTSFSILVLMALLRENALEQVQYVGVKIQQLDNLVQNKKVQIKDIKSDFKFKATETRYDVAKYVYTSRIQNIGEGTTDRPIEYLESVVNSNSTQSEKWGTGMIIIGNYLKLTVLPYPMSFYYGYKCIEKAELNQPLPLLVLTIVIALIILALWKLNKKRLLSAGLLIYFAAIFPLANIILPVSGMMADRYLFIPSLGFCILLSVVLCKFAKYPLERGGVISFFSLPLYFKYPALAILLLYSGVTIARNSQWHDPLRLMRHDIRHLEKSAQAQNLLASQLVQAALSEKSELTQKRLLEEAEPHYEKAVAIYPDFFNAHYDLGRVKMMLGKSDKAEMHFLKVIELDSTFSEPLFQVGLIKASKGDCRGALPYYHKYLKINPANLDALMNLSFCYARIPDLSLAMIPMKKAASFYPQQPEPLIYLCRIFADMGMPDSAMFYLQRAEIIAPNHPDINMLKNALSQPTPTGSK